MTSFMNSSTTNTFSNIPYPTHHLTLFHAISSCLKTPSKPPPHVQPTTLKTAAHFSSA